MPMARSSLSMCTTWTRPSRGRFYLRELPPLRAIIPASSELALILVDGYVDLDRAGGCQRTAA